MSYLGLNTTTDDHAAKASPADVRRKNRQLIFRLLFPTSIRAPSSADAPD